jgi:hypothetical protein
VQYAVSGVKTEEWSCCQWDWARTGKGAISVSFGGLLGDLHDSRRASTKTYFKKKETSLF